MHFIRTKLYCIFFLLVLSHYTSAQIPAHLLPAFAFYKQDKKIFTEKDLPPGKMLFFVFFDPTCEHCQRTVAYIDKHYTSFTKAAMIMVSMDSLGGINRFIATYGTHLKTQKNVIILQDRTYNFITMFKPKRFPGLFLYSEKKQLLDYEDSPETVPRIENVIKKSAK